MSAIQTVLWYAWTRQPKNFTGIASREPMPLRPSQIERIDSEYVRAGVGTLFMLSAPLEGWREVIVTERKTRQDYAKVLHHLSDECFPRAKKIILVQDNLNTHNPTSLYETLFPRTKRADSQSASNGTIRPSMAVG